MRLGVIGLPVAGKTTVFNALTGTNHPIGSSAGAVRLEVVHAVAEVPDRRLESLSAAYHPRKTTPLRIDLGDISGLGEGGQVSGELANELAKWDGLILTVRSFDSPLVEASPDPQRDLEQVESELLLYDLLWVEARLEGLAEQRQKGARDRAALDRELAALEKVAGLLQTERPLRAAELEPTERVMLQGYGLLSLKPLLVVPNLAEDIVPVRLTTELPLQHFYGKLEHELAELPPEEAAAFREDFEIQESGRSELLHAALAMMDQISFFTVSEQEVRAWLLPSKGTALQAAGTIHSDMERGFIRAEVIQWDRLLELGGFAEARQAGQLPSEGKDHPISDGDVVHVRFNV